MDLEISPRDIGLCNTIGIKLVFRARLKGCLTKTRINALKETKNKFGYNIVWTADRKIKTKRLKFILIDIVASSCVTKKQEWFLILMVFFYFYLIRGFFTKHFKTVSYFAFLIMELDRKIISRVKSFTHKVNLTFVL